MPKTLSCQVLLLAAAVLCSSAAAPATPPLTYNHDIRPILSDNCFACHGPDQNKRKAKLRLDIRDEAVKKVIAPGKPDESELVQRIYSADPDELMPPAKSQKSLTPAQKETLRRWIAEGATYEKHWAYIAPKKASAPQAEGAIDFLVQQRLKELGLAQSPPADRRTLARRLYFDLLGLPPSRDEVEAFEDDPSPDAYARMVESLLASPHYGERMALGWLDVVRFADTIGYHSDNPRNIWPYRDYVIRAFNSNKPFDQFTREQLAGDLLPNSNLQQKVASAFNRLLLSTEEGGAQPKDYEARMLTDRVRAIGAVWLGQTIGCAQCHDHKFDPITSRDFYSMGAFFADIKEPIIGRREDGMLVPNAKQAEELDRFDRALKMRREQYETPRPDLLSAWEPEALAAARAEPSWQVLTPDELTAESGVKLRADLNNVITTEKNPPDGQDTYRIKVHPNSGGLVGLRIEFLGSDKLPAHGPGRAKDGSLVLTRFHGENETGTPLEIAEANATTEAAGGSAATSLVSNREGAGWVLGGNPGVPQAIYFRLQTPLEAMPDSSITLVLAQTHGGNAVAGRFRIAATDDPAVVRAPKTTVPPREIADILLIPREKRTGEQADKVAAFNRSVAPELADARRQLAEAQAAKDQFEATVPRCLVSESDKPRTVRILPRGNWMLETGDIVEPELPGYLTAVNKLETSRRLTRLDLANWLVARDNPLTARVVINRLWKQFFGMGLSKVLDDFGAQGEPPPNQALLDWLACEFMDSGWDVKHLVRLIVNSRTYQQSSIASKELQARDPYNRELARQSRWRLDAELVRDNALSIAGLLAEPIGGPSVKPYQPDGYWENLNFPVRNYEASTGEDQYRRGIYSWWQRSYVHPSLLAFDAPTREECAADRPRSNIPQQALVLLNDPTYVEAARCFAVRILQAPASDAVERITWAWRQALDREPRPDELEAARALFERQLAQYHEDPKAAKSLLQVGLHAVPARLDPAEVAAWTSVARLILNLHETITRS